MLNRIGLCWTSLTVFVLSSFISTAGYGSCSDAEVVIVGGGPVGLYTAIQTKLHVPFTQIHIFEKYSVPSRKHGLSIDMKSTYKNAHTDRDFRALLDQLGSRPTTSDIETQLKQFSTQLGNEIELLKVETLKDITDRCPNVKIIVGADGLHSVVREKFFPTQSRIEKHLNSLVMVKYQAEALGDEPLRKLHYLKEARPALRKVHHTVLPELVSKKIVKDNNNSPDENNGSPSEGTQDDEKENYERNDLGSENTTHSITIPIIISMNELNELQGNPQTAKGISFDGTARLRASELLPLKLRQTVDHWLEIRSLVLKEKIVSSVSITPVPLKVYITPTVQYSHAGIQYFLVGDAATALSLQRGLNVGFESANHLANVIASQINDGFKSKPVTRPLVFGGISRRLGSSASSIEASAAVLGPWGKISQMTPDDYSDFVKKIQAREMLDNQFTNSGLSVWDLMVRSSQMTEQNFLNGIGKIQTSLGKLVHTSAQWATDVSDSLSTSTQPFSTPDSSSSNSCAIL